MPARASLYAAATRYSDAMMLIFRCWLYAMRRLRLRRHAMIDTTFSLRYAVLPLTRHTPFRHFHAAMMALRRHASVAARCRDMLLRCRH